MKKVAQWILLVLAETGVKKKTQVVVKRGKQKHLEKKSTFCVTIF